MLDLQQKLNWAWTLKNLASDYGCCGRCRWPWPFVQTHSTRYSESNGCFPLCEQCWQELRTPEARLPFYEQLIDNWRGFGKLEDGLPEAIRAAVMEGK